MEDNDDPSGNDSELDREEETENASDVEEIEYRSAQDGNNTIVNKSSEKTPNSFKIGQWNIWNYGAEGLGENSYRVKAISTIINNENFDLIGLTEINFGKSDKVNLILNQLNKLDDSSNWRVIIQTDEESKLTGSSDNAAENIAILYNANRLDLLEFDNGKLGTSFTKPIAKVNGGTHKFIRPPFGAKFKDKGSDKELTAIFAHLDSPGGSPKKESTTKSFTIDGKDIELSFSQGVNELSEAYGIKDVLDYYDSIDGDSTLVFAGDTNIKQGNSNVLSSSLVGGYKIAYGDSEEKHKTSINRSATGYSQTYDKIIFREYDSDIIDEEEGGAEFKFKSDIVQAFSNHLLNKNEMKKIYTSEFNAKPKIRDMVRKISDHAPVFVIWNTK
ncbi:MnuA family membrane nuclease [Mycoplasma sp. Ms02]|uniref:MnuA family membrane nuclease n=1 Tax=Mycoplasma sp. Ms02 TaxID=353851 RepID=UPI001C8ACA39|nr:hypothetical protein [Mycoplasma sp. Ms02]QZE12068.1 hypothetical protein K4L35_01770 [Mycoplasma sp. Ms02]